MSKIMFGSPLFGILLANGLAQGAYNGPLLVKESLSNDSLRQYSKMQKCEIFAEKTVISNEFGGLGRLSSSETRNQTFAGEHPALLEKAAQAELTRGAPGAASGMSVQYYGYIVKEDDTVTKVLLYQENSQTGQVTNNPSQEAKLLRIVIEALCPNTSPSSGT